MSSCTPIAPQADVACRRHPPQERPRRAFYSLPVASDATEEEVPEEERGKGGLGALLPGGRKKPGVDVRARVAVGGCSGVVIGVLCGAVWYAGQATARRSAAPLHSWQRMR